MPHSHIPLLSQLKNYGEGGTKFGISGNEIGKMLEYTSLLDLLPDTSEIAVQEPTGDRSALTHSRLCKFVGEEFDLKKFGLPPLARVAILLPNGPELAVCIISVISQWCAVPINPQSTSAEIEMELAGTQTQAVIILSGEGAAPALTAADNLGIGVIMLEPSAVTCGLFSLSLLRQVHYRPVVLKPPSPLRLHLQESCNFGHDQIVLILHTSGTSGNKKRVPYTLDSLMIGVACIVSSWNLSPHDVNLNMMPLFHIGGIVRNVFSPILSGGSVIACSGFDAVLFWEVLRSSVSFHVTWYYAAPTMHHAILQQAASIAEEDGKAAVEEAVRPVRMIANAAGALLPALASSLQQTFRATILTGTAAASLCNITSIINQKSCVAGVWYY
jgi:acyl-CoA synthetase (AMP-forming)/AMP-acid ligase II